MRELIPRVILVNSPMIDPLVSVTETCSGHQLLDQCWDLDLLPGERAVGSWCFGRVLGSMCLGF